MDSQKQQCYYEFFLFFSTSVNLLQTDDKQKQKHMLCFCLIQQVSAA